jgi:septal ring factor EnvC (AmiA/AmiB activator)
MTMSQQISKDEVGRRLAALEAELPEVVKERDKLKKELDGLTDKLTAANQRAEETERALWNYKSSDAHQENPFLKVLNDYVEERVKAYAEKRLEGFKLAAAPDMRDIVEQSLTLEKVTTTITAKKEHRELPSVSTLTPKGKVVALVAEGKLDSKKRASEIEGMLPPGTLRVRVFEALEALVGDDILVKVKEDRSHVAYQRHPDVVAKVD